MTEPTSTNKRQRANSDAVVDKDAPNLIKRDEEFWFDDGNIVLIARNIEFKVFKSILAKHSPFFKDMFSLPPPILAGISPGSSQVTSTVVDACPVVHLSDSPEDFRHVLRVCMPETNLSYSSFTAEGKPTFEMVSKAFAVARMAHKYQMHDMLAPVMHYLKRFFPDDLAEWPNSPFCYLLPDRPDKAILAIGAVNLAHLVDEPALLPTGLLICCMLKSADLLKGLAREDGSHEHLALEDLGRCLDARGRLTEKILVLATRIFAPLPAQGCTAPVACEKLLQRMLLGVGKQAVLFADPDVFTHWPGVYETSFLASCCERCREMLRVRDGKERQAVWDELPGIMGVQVDNWVKEKS